MSTQSTFLIFLIFVTSCTAHLSEWPKKIRVTEENKHEFGLPLGTVLMKDKRTGLYKPPPMSDDFSPEARLQVQFINKATAPNFCRLGHPLLDGSSSSSELLELDFTQFCHSPDGKDICCGKSKCTCKELSSVCGCLAEQEEIREHDEFLEAIAKQDTLERLQNPIGFFAG